MKQGQGEGPSLFGRKPYERLPLKYELSKHNVSFKSNSNVMTLCQCKTSKNPITIENQKKIEEKPSGGKKSEGRQEGSRNKEIVVATCMFSFTQRL